MNHRIRAAVLAGLSVSVVAGCAYLPQGFPSRTMHAPVDGGKSKDTASLFVDSAATQTNQNSTVGTAASGPASGLRIRKSKRGNMDSYVVRGQRYFTLDSNDGYSARGLASWYGPNFHGRTASNGETYDMYRMTAAHKTLPLPTYARVTHLDNGKSVVVKINDRGPFSGDRLIDLSFAAALELGMVNDGTAMVEIKALSPEQLMAMSGPDNKMGIEFYYDGSVPQQQKPKVALDSLFIDDRDPQSETVAPVAQADQPAAPVANPVTPQAPVAEMADAQLPVPSATSGAQEAGTVVDIASLKAEFIEVVVPERRPPNATENISAVAQSQNSGQSVGQNSGKSMVDQPIFPGEDIPLDDLAREQSVVAANSASGAAVPLLETAALPVNAAGTLPAVATVGQSGSAEVDDKPLVDDTMLGLRYYLQAGVFARVSDAERVATNIVLEIPREEVHVKPLKDSAMYRVTVGPIVSKDHAREMSLKLQTAGIENYTVKVDES